MRLNSAAVAGKIICRYLWHVLIGLTALALYGFLPGEWWYGDDPEIVVFALKHSPAAYLFNPGTWQSLSPFNLTPWILVSLRPDIALSHLEPAGYYAHHLLSLALTAIALFSLLSLYVRRRVFAFIGVIIFLLTPATFWVSTWITARHYLEGLGFFLLALSFFAKGVRAERKAFVFLSALCYIPAALSKEVFVPLPFLLMLLPEKTLRDRLTHALPHFILLMIYAAYRFWMLGNNPMGGYSSIWPWTITSALLHSGEVFRLYAGSWWIVILVLVTMAGGIFLLNNRKAAFVAVVRHLTIFLLLLLPILPVSSIWGGGESLRYFLLTSTSLTLFYALSLDVAWNRGSVLPKILTALSLIIVVAGFFHSFQREKSDFDQRRRTAEAEGRFFLENGDTLDAVFRISQPHWFFDGLEKMQAIQMRRPPERRLRLVSGDYYGFDGDGTAQNPRIFQFDAVGGEIEDVTTNARENHENFMKTLREERLHLSLQMKEGVMNLRLGPYHDGDYLMLEAPPEQDDYYYLAFPMRSSFGMKLTHRERVRIFRFAYRSPEGWMTVSPKFLIDRTKDQEIQWSRP